MKIYFAGSIRGGREDAEIYLDLIGFLKNFGVVLTEHVGDLMLNGLGDVGTPDRIIHSRDMAMLQSADVLVAEITVVSLGVGYEIGRAVSEGKKVICLYRSIPGKRISAMISGNPDVTLVNYKTAEEAKDKIREILSGIPAS